MQLQQSLTTCTIVLETPKKASLFIVSPSGSESWPASHSARLGLELATVASLLIEPFRQHETVRRHGCNAVYAATPVRHFNSSRIQGAIWFLWSTTGWSWRLTPNDSTGGLLPGIIPSGKTTGFNIQTAPSASKSFRKIPIASIQQEELICKYVTSHSERLWWKSITSRNQLPILCIDCGT